MRSRPWIPLLLSGVLALPAVGGQRVSLDAAAQSRAGIVVRPVLERSFGEQMRIFGTIVRSPGTTVTVKTRVQARVLRLHVAPGDTVRRGQPLLEIYSHDLHEMEGQVLRLREARRLADSRVEAGRQLLELEGIARIELDAREQEALAAAIDYEQSLHELEDLGFLEADVEELLETGKPDGKMTVRSPTGGVVLELEVERHEWTQAFEPLLVVGDPESLELEVEVQPTEFSMIRTGDTVDFAPVGYPGLSGRARVITPIPRVDPATRTVTLRAAILESRSRLVPGTYVEGVLVLGEARRALSVPESAVIRIGSSDHVFVRLAPDSFEARSVEIGLFNGTRYEVLVGVGPGEEVAVEGVFFLKSALIRGGGGE
jgi:cobalt-zinc-cadmium efflux system membrane fusion protein